MAAYSMDSRTRVPQDSDAGMTADAVAEKYRVSPSWVRRLKQRRRESGEIAPRKQTRWRTPILAPDLPRLETSTFVAALRITGLTAPGLLDGPMDGDAFLAYLDQVLVPTLQAGDIVVMDKLGLASRRGRPRADRRDGRAALVLAAVPSRPESDRIVVRETESAAPRCGNH